MRTERYSGLLPVEKLAGMGCTVIGVGAIGRQVALQLAAMGVSRIQLIDPDTVDETNLGSQGYLEEDVATLKVDATASIMKRLNHELEVEIHPRRFSRHIPVHPVVFCCVDSIETRRRIWRCVEGEVELFIDGRMAAEVIRIVTASDATSRDMYPTTLFSGSRAYQEGCTARSTIYCANIAAGLMVSQLAKWMRGSPMEVDLVVNLLTGELTQVG